MLTGYLRGHKMYYSPMERLWRYSDTDEPTEETHKARPCSQCQRFPTTAGHDACIANLPGVRNACCGHGIVSQAYVQFEDSSRPTLREHAALHYFRTAVLSIKPASK